MTTYKAREFSNDDLHVEYDITINKGFCGVQKSYDIQIHSLQVYVPALCDWYDMTHYKDLDDKAIKLIINEYERED